MEPRCAQAPRHLQAVHVRQAKVQDHRIEAVDAVRQLQPFAAGGGQLHHVTVVAEQPPQHAAEPRVILDDEQVH